MCLVSACGRKVAGALDAEYAFWMAPGPNSRAVNVSMTPIDGSADVVVLNRYSAVADAPRPESFSKDWATVRGSVPHGTRVLVGVYAV